MHRQLALILLAALALMLALPQPATAQRRNERRLSEHEQRIREIIQQRRQEALERERAAAAEQRRDLLTAQREAISSGQDFDRDAAIEALNAPESAVSDETLRILGNVVMGFKFLDAGGVLSYNVITQKGDTFVSELVLYNNDINPIDHIRLALDYDKRFLQPVKIFDADIRPFVEGEPNFTKNNRDAQLLYEARLESTPKEREVVLLRIMWKALRPTPFTGITFAFSLTEDPESPHTGIYYKEQNILGYPEDVQDGVLSGGVLIEPEGGKEVILQGKAEELRELYLGTGAAQASCGFRLTGPAEAPKVGDVFPVHVSIENPEGALVDTLSFFATFDPAVLQVVDTDRFNWIERGVNVHDGPYHEEFPWDMHKRNEVRNDRGLVHYSKSLTSGRSLQSETFATIHFRAIAPTTRTEIAFVKGRTGAPDLSSIRYFGFELLDLRPPVSHPLYETAILNAPIDVASQNTGEAVSEIAAPEDLSVRSLRIVRE